MRYWQITAVRPAYTGSWILTLSERGQYMVAGPAETQGVEPQAGWWWVENDDGSYSVSRTEPITLALDPAIAVE